MNRADASAYGLWSLVIINSLVFIIFAFSFAKPQTSRDWRSFGAFSAFLVALFTEMYGFPLTIYLLSGWLSSHFPNVDWIAHDSGHLLEMIFGWKTNPHFGPFRILSNILIVAGFILLSASWTVLYAAQRNQKLATSGPYARVRHPQYVQIHLDHVRIFAAVADPAYGAHVPGTGHDVHSARASRRTRCAGGIRRAISALQGRDTEVFPQTRKCVQSLP